MVKDHQGKCRCFSNPTSSTLSNLLEPWNWSVRVSPPPEDIYWENLTESHRLFFFKTLVINFFLFILLFFLTSPATIISQLEAIIHLKSLTQDLPEKVNDFVPTLLLWTLSALLPIIVAYSGTFLNKLSFGKQTGKCKQNHMIIVYIIVFYRTFFSNSRLVDGTLETIRGKSVDHEKSFLLFTVHGLDFTIDGFNQFGRISTNVHRTSTKSGSQQTQQLYREVELHIFAR